MRNKLQVNQLWHLEINFYIRNRGGQKGQRATLLNGQVSNAPSENVGERWRVDFLVVRRANRELRVLLA